MPTSHFWREWEGHTLAGQYHLSRLWGSTDHTAVFAAEKSAVKLIAQEAAGPGDVLARYGRIRHLTHPQLMPLLDYGTEARGGQRFYYTVSELATDDLARLLTQRALTPEEAGEVLRGLLSVLGFLHGRGLVHSAIRPSNVFLVDDRLKVSSDTIQDIGPAKPRGSGRPNPYDAPELLHDELRPESDVWMLGVLLYESLTRSRTLLADAHEALPAPFNTIVRGCLRKDPNSRWTLPQIDDLLEGRLEPIPEETQQLAPLPGPQASHGILPPMSLFPRLLLIAAAVVVAVVCYAVLGHNQPSSAATPAPVITAPPNEDPPPPAAVEEPARKAQKARRKHRRHR